MRQARAGSRGVAADVLEPPRVAALGDAPGPTALPDPVRLRPMAETDLGFVVAEHLYHFPRGFFARLGPWFMREYYRAFLTGPSAHAVVAERAGGLVGYLVGVTDPVAHRDHVVRRHGARLACRGALLLLVRPGLCVSFLRTRALLYARKLLRRRRPAGRAACDPRVPGVLTHVAVTPTCQRQGVGDRLLGWFEHEATACGCTRVVLVTASGEGGAGCFYERRGWRPVGEHRTPDGLALHTYELTLTHTGGGSAVMAG
jgi:ribosomal protein S18 acetylase RimI-like enzyme